MTVRTIKNNLLCIELFIKLLNFNFDLRVRSFMPTCLLSDFRMVRFVELAAKYGFTDDGQSIDGWEEDAGFEGGLSDTTARAILPFGNAKKEPQAVGGRMPAVQKTRKVAPNNHLSSIEVRVTHV